MIDVGAIKAGAESTIVANAREHTDLARKPVISTAIDTLFLANRVAQSCKRDALARWARAFAAAP